MTESCGVTSTPQLCHGSENITPSKIANGATATYNWVVTGPTRSTNHICVTSTVDPLGTDTSDVSFTIAP